MLQPATKALAQVLAGRTGVSGQLGHARTMLAQAERLIAERTHNRLTPAEREEFFEQLARLKLTLADADAEAEVQAVEDQEPRPQAPPVAQERLKEMALALTARDRPDQAEASAQPAASGEAAPDPTTAAGPAEEVTPSVPSDEPASGQRATPTSAVPGRLVLPRATADQAAQAVAVGAFARRRSRASREAAAAAGAAAADEAARPIAPETRPAEPPSVERRAVERRGPEPGADALESHEGGAGESHDGGADASHEGGAGESHDGNGAAARAETKAPARSTTRRSRKPKHQGLPEGWVIDEEGFVVPGVD